MDGFYTLGKSSTGSTTLMPIGSTLLNNTLGYTIASTDVTTYIDNIVHETATYYLDKVMISDGMLKRTNAITETTPVLKYHYFLKDHLGNVRVVFDEDGIIKQVNNYYPFGMEWGESAEDQTSMTYQNNLFGGKEFDRKFELNTYDFVARNYDATIGRFTTPDPLAEKYYSISPYAYVANNPMRYVDYLGDSISVAGMQGLDRILGTNYAGSMTSDLQSQTGLTYSVSSTGDLNYAKDVNGNPIIATTTDANENTIIVGSATARNLMIGAINNSSTVTVGAGRRSLTDGPANNIGLSFSQIEDFIQGSYGLDNRTMGWGMTFMHELKHTAVGGGLSDASGWGNIGAVENQMNVIRSELNVPGGNYGQRLNYEAIRLTPTGAAYVPFNRSTVNIMESGIIPVPTRGMQFIRISRP